MPAGNAAVNGLELKTPEECGWKHGDKCLVVFEGTIDAVYSSGVMVHSDGRYIQAKWRDLKQPLTADGREMLGVAGKEE